MKKKFTMICVFVVTLALTVTVSSVRFDEGANISDASIGTYAAKAGTTSLGGFVSEKVDAVTNVGEIVSDVSDVAGDLGGILGGLGGSSGGLGGAIGGIGDAVGGLIGNIGGSSGSNSSVVGTSSVTYSVNTNYVGYIEPVPFASDNSQSTTENNPVNETVDFAATKNPYAKPTKELKGGDKGDGVKWMQWIFIYTRYGLKDDGITGVFDEDTVAVVKKLQKEKGLTVDGIVNDEVIAQIELLYFEATYTGTVPFDSSTSAEDTATTGETAQVVEKENDGLIILTIVVAALWVIAIAFIVVLFIVKRKKKKAENEKAKVEETKSTEETKQDETSI